MVLFLLFLTLSSVVSGEKFSLSLSAEKSSAGFPFCGSGMWVAHPDTNECVPAKGFFEPSAGPNWPVKSSDREGDFLIAFAATFLFVPFGGKVACDYGVRG